MTDPETHYKPLVTVQLMCCETDFQYVPRAVKSIKSQDLPLDLIELQIVHDGPPGEEASEVLEEVADSLTPFHYAVVVWSDSASGYYTVPRNQAFPHTKGLYLTFMDADNEMKPPHLSGLLEALRGSKCDFAYTRRHYVFDEGVVNKTCASGPSALVPWTRESARRLESGPANNFVDTGDIMVARSVLFELADSMGSIWNSSCRKFGDWDLVCRMSQAGFTGLAVDQVTNIYHWTGKNISTERYLSDLVALPVELYERAKAEGKIVEN
jgi:glycosyltransferase involved in cell wall biosynthesis